jgi:hypothetical protein
MTESQQPNPFSRQASEPTEGLSANPYAGSASPPAYRPSGGESPDQYAGDWPSYPADDPYRRPEVDPYAVPGEPYGNPNANSTYVGPEVGFAPQPTPPYGDFGHNYGQPGSYATTPYEANPYRPAFGAVSPYGPAPEVTPAQQHPQATLALILGILGTVLGMSCIVGGLVGIGGIVVGRRVRNEIDAEPGRYTGRSQAVGGLVTGMIGVSIFTLVTILIVVAVVVGIASTNF